MCIYEGIEFGSDTGRVIRKYAVWVCDLGEPVDNNLGKKRPCVIIQSNKLNNPKQCTYIVAPIRTEHTMKVSRETLQDIVDAKRKVGRIYVPIEMDPGNFRFIDMTRLQCVYSSNILIYKFDILNSEVKKKIADTMHEILFSDEEVPNTVENETPKYDLPDEFNGSLTDYISSLVNNTFSSIEAHKSEVIKQKQREGIDAAKKAGKHLGRPKITVPDNFSEVYYKWIRGEITAKAAIEVLQMSNTSFYKVAKKYEEEHNIDRNLLKQKYNPKDSTNSKVNANQNVVDNKPAVKSFINIYQKVITKKISTEKAAKQLSIQLPVFINLMEEYEKDEAHKFNTYQKKGYNGGKTKAKMPDTFIRAYIQWNAKMLNGHDAAKQINISYSTFLNLAHRYEIYKNNTTL